MVNTNSVTQSIYKISGQTIHHKKQNSIFQLSYTATKIDDTKVVCIVADLHKQRGSYGHISWVCLVWKARDAKISNIVCF